jgi:hypothetical protein
MAQWHAGVARPAFRVAHTLSTRNRLADLPTDARMSEGVTNILDRPRGCLKDRTGTQRCLRALHTLAGEAHVLAFDVAAVVLIPLDARLALVGCRVANASCRVGAVCVLQAFHARLARHIADLIRAAGAAILICALYASLIRRNAYRPGRITTIA